MKATLKVRKPITHIEVDIDENELEVVGYVKERHGHWNVIDQAEPRRYGCSRCKRMMWTTENYCPNCGAKMDEEAQDAGV